MRIVSVRILVASGALLGAAASASAADLPTKAPLPPVPVIAASPWSGLYVGVNGGWAFDGKEQTLAGASAAGAAAIGAGLVPSSFGDRWSGGMAGGLVGYNWQFGAWLAGVEADIDWADVSNSGGSIVSPAPAVAVTSTGTSKLGWLGTVRARAGWLPLPNTLVYATGGLAYGGVSSNAEVAINAGALAAAAANSPSTTRVGWTVGAGVEQRLLDRWTVRAEYLFTDLGHESNPLGTTIFGVPVSFTSDQKLTFQTVRMALTYRF